MPPSRGMRMSGYTQRMRNWPSTKRTWVANARKAVRRYNGTRNRFIRAFKAHPAYGVYKNWRMARRVRRARR